MANAHLSILEFRTARNVLGVEHDREFLAGCRAFGQGLSPLELSSAAYRAGHEWQRLDYQRQIDGIAPDGRPYGEAF